MAEKQVDLMQTGMLILIGAVLCAILLVPSIIQISNSASRHEKVMIAIQSVKDDLNRAKVDGLIRAEMDAKLEAIDNE